MRRSDLKESCVDGTGESVDHDIEHVSWTDEQGRLTPLLEQHSYSVALSNHDGDSIPARRRIHKKEIEHSETGISHGLAH